MNDFRWGKTGVAIDRKDSEITWKNGQPHYKGRHIIGRDTDIDGGVYLGGGEREAVVVDTAYNGVNELYQEALQTSNDLAQDSEFEEYHALFAAFDTVKDHMEYDESQVENLVKETGKDEDGKIALTYFIQNGVGVCRHHALASAAVLEQFQNDNLISGDISVDRNQATVGGHAWTRYEHSDSDTVHILDPAQNTYGMLDIVEDEPWDYRRPHER